MIKKAIGDEIRRYRKEQSLTFEALAHRSNIGLTFLKELESGKKQASVTTLYKLAFALEITPDLLIMPYYSEWLKEQN